MTAQPTNWQYRSVEEMKTDNKAFWQWVAKLYGPVMERSGAKLYRDICDRIKPYLKRDMNVLELACGTGQLSYPLSSRVRHWEATDFSPAMIAEAKKKNNSSRLHFSVQNATALPYAPESFDAVVIANALHIMPDPDKAMVEIQRVLKPEGFLFAPTFVHGEGTGFRVRVRLIKLVGFHTYHEWDAGAFVEYLSAHSFAVFDQAVLGGSMAPLCCAMAKRKKS